MAWQFVAAMLDAAGDDGNVPGGVSPWLPPPPPPPPASESGSTNPPLLTLATAFVYAAGGVNKTGHKQLAWALPRLERYIEWDLANRAWKGSDSSNSSGKSNSTDSSSNNSTVLLAWAGAGESGLDNSVRHRAQRYCAVLPPSPL